MSTKTVNGDQKTKLTQLINEGMGVLHENETPHCGLNDTIKAVAEEMEIRPALLKKAIKIAHKASLIQTNKDHDELTDILTTVGKTL